MKNQKKIIAILFLVLFIALGLSFSKAKYPKEWIFIQIGKNIRTVQKVLPTIKHDTKDTTPPYTWYSCSIITQPFLIKYRWHINIETDRNGVILGFNGRSYNHITGFFDMKFNM